MAKLKLARFPVQSLRLIAGMRGHVPGPKAACIGKKLDKNEHPQAEPGAGGRRNKGWQKNFLSAALSCGVNLSPATKRKWGL